MKQIEDYINKQVDDSVIPLLMDYIRIPNLSPDFDENWETNGLMDQAVNLFINWTVAQNISGLTYQLLKEPGCPPLLFIQIEASQENLQTVLMYGHMDKQPHFTGWREGTGPTTPVIIEGLLYGRGAADDGYALPGSILIIKSLQNLGMPHGKIVIVIENEEESGSLHLMDYLDKLNQLIGQPQLIICLDSGCRNYKQLWTTKSLRGVLELQLTIKVLEQEVQSGNGIIPDIFRILRILLDRLEDSSSGEMKIPELFQEIAPKMYLDAVDTANILGEDIYNNYPFIRDTQPVTKDQVQCVINRGMKPTLSVVGLTGLPQAETAGSILQKSATFKLSIRLPPNVDGNMATQAITRELIRNSPYNAQVSVSDASVGNGFLCPEYQKWLDTALSEASEMFFQKPARTMSEGVSIPFMGMLSEKFPQAQFAVFGLLGPGSNAHSSNEALNITYLKKMLCCVAYTVQAHAIK